MKISIIEIIFFFPQHPLGLYCAFHFGAYFFGEIVKGTGSGIILLDYWKSYLNT